MDRITLFHGSDHIIEKPQKGIGNIHNDYGPAFYCTTTLDMAKEWANRAATSGYVNKYKFDGRGLKVLDLTDNKYSALNWVAILIHFKELSDVKRITHKRRLEFLEEHYYIDISDYDVIIGYRADDAYFKFPLSFIDNELSLERLEEIYKLGNLGKQIAIVSEKAFSKLMFVSSTASEAIYHERYLTRKNKADARFTEIRVEELNKDKPRIDDLIREYGKHN